MPIHDWTRVDSGLFHAFHQSWIIHLCDALNDKRLPEDYYALPEQRSPGLIPDVLTLKLAEDSEPGAGSSALAVATAPPRTRFVARSDADVYAEKANRLVIHHRHGEIVAIVEIVSPGNKSSIKAFHDFTDKAASFVLNGVSLLIIDLFPPSTRDPRGIHEAIWGDFFDEKIVLPADKPLTLAAYQALPERVAYVEPVAVGDALPDMPIFLLENTYVPAPLEATYQTTWNVFPRALKPLLETPLAR